MQILKPSESQKQTQTNSPHFLFKAKTKGKEAVGILSVADKSWPAISGPWGNGYLPEGDYIAEGFEKTDGAAYSYVDKYTGQICGFYIRLTPKFSTKRFDLLIHFDGNVRGSLGCCAIQVKNIFEALEIYDFLKDLMTKNKTVDFSAVYNA